MRRIAVIATGGTIASTSTASGVVATRSADKLLSDIHGSTDVELVDLMTVGSYRMTFEDMRRICTAVAEVLGRAERPVDGVVITHGTDTMEETAVLLDAVHNDDRPVVLTGAQRASDRAESDGPANLADAIAVASSLDARGLGALVVFAGRILPARGTQKIHTTDLDAFATRSGFEVGRVSNGAVTVTGKPQRPPALAAPTPSFDATRVDAVGTYPGADSALFTAAAAAGAAGIVVVGTGIGNANPDIAATLTRLVADGVAVVLSTRVAHGDVAGVYGAGGGADLIAAGIPPASGLPASQVRIILALWLSGNQAPAAHTQEFVDRYVDNNKEE